MMDEESLNGEDLELDGFTLADASDADGEWDELTTDPSELEDDVIEEEDGGDQEEAGGVINDNVATLDTTVNVSAGDRVIITVIDGEPVVTGVVGGGDNMAEDIDEALEQSQRAADAADAAEASAAQAATSAASANASATQAASDASSASASAAQAASDASAAAGSASDAASAASAAQRQATAATASADEAKQQAQEAQGAASDAKVSARSALYSLGDVEKVIESLTWIEEHGHYLLTTDEAVDPSASYYTLSGGLYYLTSDREPDPFTQYYSHSHEFEPTDDEEPDAGKSYYVKSGGGYEEVASPDAADIASYYERRDAYSPIPAADVASADMAECYERAGFVRSAVAEPSDERLGEYFVLVVDESVRNYLATHLALTERGLELAGTPDGYRATLTTQGLEIRDPDNRLVGLHGETVQLGSADGIYFEAGPSRLSFRTASELIAYFGLNSDGIWEMHISTSYVDDMMRFGDYAFIKRKNGNLSLKWLGD